MLILFVKKKKIIYVMMDEGVTNY